MSCSSGNLEEERLLQMVHDFIESESTSPPFSSSSHHTHVLPLHHKTMFFHLQEILGNMSDAETQVLENVLKHTRRKRVGAEKTWLVMRLKMDGYNASLCHTSWVSTCGCPGGYYEYIDVIVKDKNGKSVRLVVDIDFKSQFEVARPTSAYKQLSDALPSIFVGEEGKLNDIITLLCSAAKQSLKESGLYIPPWRTSTYMYSKWGSKTRSQETVGREDGKVAKAAGSCVGNSNSKFNSWAPPVVKPKRTDLGGGGSGLSSQFSSNTSINCC
ncbi:uncharacterized protein LOC131151399 [Malania oleifera]|uniref:uncharacterized protein LOC131151399 n=1 Tax=Malania oleifera TaxID=397392 RepID=UPI0025AE3BD0|nr:uncharacterized protein LOC131151399 [Malania oleifera]XP_057958632.1 uncharacterized protein LOC131151399 [Malania oleifera]